jgi:L-alanine-DL-glutamate epimerase-like enolase superfamily enzyme
VVVQTLPNSTKCGGLTEAWRIAWKAYEHDIQWVPHGWNTAVGLAADLALSAAMPVARHGLRHGANERPFQGRCVAWAMETQGCAREPQGCALGW